MAWLRTTAIALLLIATHVGGALTAGRAASVPEATHHQFQSSIWLPFWLAGAAGDVSANAGSFRTASLFWYEAASCSSIRLEPGAGDRQVVRQLRAKGLRVLATVVGSGLPPRAAIRCFSDPARRHQHVRRLVRLAVDDHYAGIDIDYETLAHTTQSHRALGVRRAFNLFITDLCSALHDHGKLCDVTVMPRVDDSTRVALGAVTPGVYDYTTIGSAADRMRVMAYDQHSGRFGPGPVAGYPWVRRVIGYTATKTPLANVELGIPLYGRDFSRNDSAALSSRAALALARRHGITPHFNRTQREETFRYRAHRVRHTVWFSSPRAVAARARLALSRGMAGAAYWAATYELPATWHAVRRATT